MIDGPYTRLRRRLASIAALFAAFVLYGLGAELYHLSDPTTPARVVEVDAHGYAELEARWSGVSVRTLVSARAVRGLAPGAVVRVRCGQPDPAYPPLCHERLGAAKGLLLLGIFLATAGVALVLLMPELRARLARGPAFGGGAVARAAGAPGRPRADQR